MRVFVVLASVLFAVTACSSSDSSSSSSSGSTGSSGSSGATPACPTVSGNWKVTQHCDSTLVGSPIVVTQNGCNLTFSAPFDKFSASETSDGKLTVTGPQTCTGTASPTGITMNCTPGTCVVTLSR